MWEDPGFRTAAIKYYLVRAKFRLFGAGMSADISGAMSAEGSKDDIEKLIEASCGPDPGVVGRCRQLKLPLALAVKQTGDVGAVESAMEESAPDGGNQAAETCVQLHVCRRIYERPTMAARRTVRPVCVACRRWRVA